MQDAGVGWLWRKRQKMKTFSEKQKLLLSIGSTYYKIGEDMTEGRVSNV
jgi:hypothetical protein